MNKLKRIRLRLVGELPEKTTYERYDDITACNLQRSFFLVFSILDQYYHYHWFIQKRYCMKLCRWLCFACVMYILLFD